MARELPPHIASRTVAEMRRLANEADAVTVQALYKTGVVLAHARPIFDDLEALAVAIALAHATYTPLRASTEPGLSTRSSVSRVTGLPRETVRRRIARLIDAAPAARVPYLAFQPDSMSTLPILPIDEVVTSFYIRLRVADQTGVLAKITGILAEQGISIDAVIQREADEVSGEGGNQTDLIILTHDTTEGGMNKALAAMQALPTVLAPIVKLRKEELA